MTESEFLKYASSGNIINAGSPMHGLMHSMSQRALRLTAVINNFYHTFGLFPPFYTDCGQNISIGHETFKNMGCTFQDWGGIEIGEECLICGGVPAKYIKDVES